MVGPVYPDTARVESRLAASALPDYIERWHAMRRVVTAGGKEPAAPTRLGLIAAWQSFHRHTHFAWASCARSVPHRARGSQTRAAASWLPPCKASVWRQ